MVSSTEICDRIEQYLNGHPSKQNALGDQSFTLRESFRQAVAELDEVALNRLEVFIQMAPPASYTYNIFGREDNTAVSLMYKYLSGNAEYVSDEHGRTVDMSEVVRRLAYGYPQP